MKNTSIITAAAAVAALTLISSCSQTETAAAETSSASSAETSVVTTELIVSAEYSGGNVTDVLPVEINDDTGEGEAVVTAAAESYVASTDITMLLGEPEETVTLDISDIESSELPENFGEFKDDSYWESRLGSAGETCNKIFLVSVDPDTTDDMMKEVTEKYSLEVIYDYENFNMYALAVPEPLDAEGTESFMTELLDTYDFILMIEPDSVMYLDDMSDQ